MSRGQRGKSLEQRFWEKVDKSGDCWLWTAAKRQGGYGMIGIAPSRARQAHRVSWMIHNGPIPDGLCVLHRCDNPPCVNPTHLFLGTHKDNTRDKIAKGRSARKGGRRVLSTEKVLDIRRRRLSGEKALALALEFGVYPSTITDIVNRTTWSDLEEIVSSRSSSLQIHTMPTVGDQQDVSDTATA